MIKRLQRRLSYANVMATLAVFLGLAGGVAWALGPNSVTSREIKNNAVKFQDLEGIKAWSKRVAVTGSDPSPLAARAEAKAVPLAKRGTITIYGKCFRNETINSVFGLTYAKTSVNGVLHRQDNGSAVRLEKNTPEQNRNISGGAGATNNQIGFWDPDFERTTIISPKPKLALNVVSHPVAKNGTPAIGNAPFGTGDGCWFSGFAVG
jgi:hypothetical protein